MLEINEQQLATIQSFSFYKIFEICIDYRPIHVHYNIYMVFQCTVYDIYIFIPRLAEILSLDWLIAVAYILYTLGKK